MRGLRGGPGRGFDRGRERRLGRRDRSSGIKSGTVRRRVCSLCRTFLLLIQLLICGCVDAEFVAEAAPGFIFNNGTTSQIPRLRAETPSMRSARYGSVHHYFRVCPLPQRGKREVNLSVFTLYRIAHRLLFIDYNATVEREKSS